MFCGLDVCIFLPAFVFYGILRKKRLLLLTFFLLLYIMSNVDTKREKFSGKIAAFVSGGVDSMVMLDMLVKSGADVFVVHVNHGIRKEADSDCRFVQMYCEQIGVPFVSYSFDIPKLASQFGRSIETEARLRRQEVMQQLLAGKKADKVALAHHADDNAETVLMHVLRGCGVDGLKGITQSESILRPLLNFTREQITQYAEQNGVPYVVDKTNFDSTYTRNFIRHEVLPLVKTRYPGAVEALNRLAENATELLGAVDSQLDYSLIVQNENEVRLSLKAFESPFVANYVIAAAKKLMPIDVTKAHIVNVLNLKNAESGSKAELAGSLKAYKEYDSIVFCFDKPKFEFCVPFTQGAIKLGKFTIKITPVSPEPIKGKTIIDADLPLGIVFRNRKEGDKFIPYGGKSKSLKKYLIDKKVPQRLRDDLVCLCDGDDVLAVVGVEISDKCKITSKTQKAYLLEVERE